MDKKITLLICFSLVCYSYGFSQNKQETILTLNECIQIALENNLDFKRSKLSAKSSKINYRKSRSEILPNLNLNYNIGVNNGRSIDPFTNDYINQELTFSNAGLNLNAIIFDGFRILNRIKQERYNLQASEMEIEEAKQNLILDVSLQYIQVLNSRDLLELAKSRLETTKKQLKRLEILYKEDIGNPVNYTDMQGQFAIDKIGIINAETTFKAVVLDLIQLLNLETNPENKFETVFDLVTPEKYQFSALDVYNDALKNLATFKSKTLKIDAASLGVKVARSNYFPEITFFGRLNTNYSNAAQLFTQTGTVISETGDFVTIGSQDYAVLQNKNVFESDKIDYMDQFDNNLNSVIGVSVRVPLFNGFRTKNEISIKKNELEETKIDLENTKLLFKQSIEQAYNNMLGAFSRCQELQNQVTAFGESFRVNEIRFNNGISNIVDYITSKNNLDSAKLNLNKTKYEYVLRVKILDYYRGIK